jgi:hypothetical protein
MQITQLLNNNCFPGRNGLKPKWLILHATAGGTSALEIAQFFKGTEGSNNPVSATYVVDQEAVIYQCNLESDGAWGNGPITGVPANLPFRTVGDGVHRDAWWDPSINPNNVTISIEHVKPDSQNVTALTPAQQAASFALILDICQRNGIPMRPADASGGITGHFSMDPTERSFCPNTYPWDELWTYLANGGQQPMSNIPTGWTDDGHTLKAPNGIPVVLGFRDHVLTSNWDPTNWPLEPEQHLTGLEQSNPSLGDGQSQIFRKTRLEYNAKMGIFEGWLGQELLWYQKEVELLKQQPVAATLAQIGSLATQASTALAKIGSLAQVL